MHSGKAIMLYAFIQFIKYITQKLFTLFTNIILRKITIINIF